MEHYNIIFIDSLFKKKLCVSKQWFYHYGVDIKYLVFSLNINHKMSPKKIFIIILKLMCIWSLQNLVNPVKFNSNTFKNKNCIQNKYYNTRTRKQERLNKLV